MRLAGLVTDAQDRFFGEEDRAGIEPAEYIGQKGQRLVLKGHRLRFEGVLVGAGCVRVQFVSHGLEQGQ